MLRGEPLALLEHALQCRCHRRAASAAALQQHQRVAQFELRGLRALACARGLLAPLLALGIEHRALDP